MNEKLKVLEDLKRFITEEEAILGARESLELVIKIENGLSEDTKEAELLLKRSEVTLSLNRAAQFGALLMLTNLYEKD